MRLKKIIILLIIIIMICLNVSARNRFFIQNRLGDLIKVDTGSALVQKKPKLKGPRLDEVPVSIDKEIFENDILSNLNITDKNFIKTVYTINGETGFYELKDEIGVKIKSVGRIHNIFRSNKIAPTYVFKFSKKQFENTVLTKITDEDDKNFITDLYEPQKNKYLLKLDLTESEKLREIFMILNKDNEMKTGLDEHGTPMPHNFPRVFEAKSKSHFDIHFAWGVKFDNIKNADNVDIGYITFGFSINLTNIIMPSLEILLKYNFMLYGYPVEPYIGGVLYGGFLDGFPIGLSVIGGVDIFPMYYENRIDNKNFYLTAEARFGGVLYSKIYFDTGLNNEGIWKKLALLVEGGFYIGYGYIFENY